MYNDVWVYAVTEAIALQYKLPETILYEASRPAARGRRSAPRRRPRAGWPGGRGACRRCRAPRPSLRSVARAKAPSRIDAWRRTGFDVRGQEREKRGTSPTSCRGQARDTPYTLYLLYTSCRV